MFKQQKGITLVALVITIIVLLILAGVSISLVVGQNGVLTRATSAVSSQKASSAKQAVSLAISSLETEYFSDWATNQSKTRAEYFTETKLAAELSSQGYTLVSASNSTFINTSDTLPTVFQLTSGSDTIFVTVSVTPAGQVNVTEVSIRDGSTNTVVNGI
jgi:Tfp pilus assembly major pilin PilA